MSQSNTATQTIRPPGCPNWPRSWCAAGLPVIVTQGSHYSALAAKAATTTIPIVFTTGVDPVQQGIVPSLNRPGGNVTGVVFMNLPAISKRLGILHQLLPEQRVLPCWSIPQHPSSPRSRMREPQL
jgi:ABC-type uncharacterized transport system substrate-binding protein